MLKVVDSEKKRRILFDFTNMKLSLRLNTFSLRSKCVENGMKTSGESHFW